MTMGGRAGTTVGGRSGTPGGMGGTGARETGEGSSQCVAYQQAPTVGDACALLLDPCPSDLTAALEAINTETQSYYFARVGCGMTELAASWGLGGLRLSFDADGALVGFGLGSDTTWGPCEQIRYELGTSLEACSEVRDCALSPDAAQTGMVCRCACPDPPRVDGLSSGDLECVYRPGYGAITCLDQLSKWVLPSSGVNGLIRRGCEMTELLWAENGDELRCLYDSSEALVGASRIGPDACPGVNGWTNGEAFSCDPESACVFGVAPDDNLLPDCAATYPFL